MGLVGVGRRIGGRFQAKAASVLSSLETGSIASCFAWLFLAGLACAARVALSPLKAPLGLDILAPYLLLVCVPVVSIGLALRWFADGDDQVQPEFRCRGLANGETSIDPKRGVTACTARAEFMVSLLIGILINVPFRAIEYLARCPRSRVSFPPGCPSCT